MASPLVHRLSPMSGRDPDEAHRAATPLELLFDLTFVVAFGIAADQLAHYLAEDHIRTSLLSFGFVAFGISWAWINFSWFASAYDTDDWVFRLLTLIQMVGVLVFALGIADVYASIDEGEHVDNGVLVAGYVVMRVAMVAQWLRAARQDPGRRRACQTYVVTITVAQAGWIVLAFAQTSVGAMFAWAAVLLLIELGGPVLAERGNGGTPWHPHHIAERYGLLVIIALGEAILGTIAALGAIVGPEGQGWSVDAAVVGFAGVTLTFGMWWIYFVVPSGDILEYRRERSFAWGYGHIPLFGALVATGAGLHAAAYLVEHKTELDVFDTLLTTAIPLAIYVLGIYLLFTYLSRMVDPFHFVLVAVSAAVLAASVAMAAAGVDIEWCLLVLSLVPWVSVVGYETVGHRHNAEVIASLAEPSPDELRDPDRSLMS
jgi:low temperature requirement protein LtrA